MLERSLIIGINPMKQDDFLVYVVEDLLGNLEGVASRAMFGGYGLYKNGMIFGMIVYGVLYFKVGDGNRPAYEKLGSKPFTYMHGNKKPVQMSYWEVPEEIMDDRAEIANWLDESLAQHKQGKSAKSAGKKST